MPSLFTVQFFSFPATRPTYFRYHVMLVPMLNRWQRPWRGGTRSTGDEWEWRMVLYLVLMSFVC